MDPNDKTHVSQMANKMRAEFTLLQRNTVLLTLPGLLVGVILLGIVASQENSPLWALTTAVGLVLLIVVVWQLSRVNFSLASLTLVIGTFGAVLSISYWGDIPAAIGLFIIPVGMAEITLGSIAGIVAAVICTALLFINPGQFFHLNPSLRNITTVEIWASVGMIWLTLKPLLTAVDWSWKAYEESSILLDQSREYQMRLAQTLEDLTNANTQLNRLNILANNLRQEAEEERHIKEQFVANVSHELRTPLNMIIGFCEMILKNPGAYGQKIPTNLLADLQVVLRNSQHLSSLIDDVLDLSQIEAGQMALSKEWVEIPEIVEAACLAVRPLYESKKLILETDIQPGLPVVFCDRTRIREVFLNLLSNAGRFTEEGGVLLRAWKEGASVEFCVKDTGPGISEEEQHKLFKPFQQLDASIRRRHGGTGLGLNISKSFVELHDGKMWVESQKGYGTSFYFTLPIEPVNLQQGSYRRWVNPYMTFEKPTRLTAVPVADSRPRVVVIEKGTVLQRLLKRYLMNTEIVPAGNLESARSVLEQTPARLVLVNDAQITHSFEEFSSGTLFPLNTPAIACSIAESIEFAPSPDVVDILVKPISRDMITSALEKIARPVKTILITEDEPDAQKLFIRMIATTDKDYQVLRASNGLHALNLLQRRKVDVILLDLFMPEMDGYEFLKVKALNEKLQDIPVILISARDPQGHPMVSNFLAATRSGGLSVQQLLDSIQALSAILAPDGRAAALTFQEASPD